MILTVCVQNSITTLAGYSEGGERTFTATTSTDDRATRDRLAAEYSALMALYGARGEEIDGAALASVVPSISEPAAEAVRLICGRRPIVVGPGTRTGFAIGAENPSELGADIVALAAGALAKYEPPLVAAHFGDALVVLALDARPCLCGCAIAPGIKLSLDALRSEAMFSSLGFSLARSPMGRNTQDAVSAGLCYGIAGAAEALCRAMSAEVGAKTVVVSGEYAGELMRRTALEVEEVDGLVADGLYAVYVKNAQTRRR